MRHRGQQVALLTLVIASCSALSGSAASSDLAAITRKALLKKCAAAAVAAGAALPSAAIADFSKYGSVPGNVITLPLENCGGSFCTLFTIDSEVRSCFAVRPMFKIHAANLLRVLPEA
jgi:hypothetical protein